MYLSFSCNDIQLLSCFLAPSGFLLNAMGTCCLNTGFVPETCMFFFVVCGDFYCILP